MNYKVGDKIIGKKSSFYAGYKYEITSIDQYSVRITPLSADMYAQTLVAHIDDITDEFDMLNMWYPGVGLTEDDDEEWKKLHQGIYHCAPLAHNWIDTGMKKTWCKTCNVKGFFNGQTGKYEEDV